MASSPPTPTPNTTRATRRAPARGGSARRSHTTVPRWVQVFVIIAVVLVLLFVILHLTGNGFGDHLHLSAIAVIREHGVQPR